MFYEARNKRAELVDRLWMTEVAVVSEPGKTLSLRASTGHFSILSADDEKALASVGGSTVWWLMRKAVEGRKREKIYDSRACVCELAM